MDALNDKSKKPPHLRIADALPRVRRFAPLAPDGGTFVDVTCGGGRHSRPFLDVGYPVVAIDRTLDTVSDLGGRPDAELIRADLEDGELLEQVRGRLRVVAYGHGHLESPFPDRLFPGIVRRLCAVNDVKRRHARGIGSPAHPPTPRSSI